MKKITNQEVYDALTHCIDKRWALHASDPTGHCEVAPSCALCELFDGGTTLGGYSSPPCRGCPVYLMNEGKGCAYGSAYFRWANTLSIETARAMLNSLKQAKAHFFGDWKP